MNLIITTACLLALAASCLCLRRSWINRPQKYVRREFTMFIPREALLFKPLPPPITAGEQIRTSREIAAKMLSRMWGIPE